MKFKSIDDIENAIKELTPPELIEFRNWFYNYDQMNWDKQLKDDINSGKLDSLVSETLSDYSSGKTTEI